MNMDYKTCGRCGKVITHGSKCNCTLEEEREKKREYMQEYEENNSKSIKPIKTAAYRRFRNSIISRDGGHCQRCKILLNIITSTQLEVHHIKPRIEYPELIYDRENVVTLCKQCNMALGISGKLDFEFKPVENDDYTFV